MSFYVKYDAYPDKIGEVRMELGSPEQYQTIQAVEVIPLSVAEQELPKEYEIQFKVVDNSTDSVTTHHMTREELNDYISVLKHILAQSK